MVMRMQKMVSAEASSIVVSRRLMVGYSRSTPCCFLPAHNSNTIQTSSHLNSDTARSSWQDDVRQQSRKPRLQKQTQQQQHTPPRTQQRPPIQQQRRQSTSSPKLEPPEIIYSNNHLLVVNKPAGWKSQPGDGGGTGSMSNAVDPKCLLTYLQNQSLGGGSQKNFISPTHRLDQPCTGALIFAKNGKAASRVQVAWAKRNVKKCYWVVVEGGIGNGGGRTNGLELLQSRSMQLKQRGLYQMSAVLKTGGGKGRGTSGNTGSNKPAGGGSVTVSPVPPNLTSKDIGDVKHGRICHIEWKHLLALPSSRNSPSNRHLLSVTTDTGAKHQIRAMLALAGGAPISGDLRYGNNVSNINQSGGRVSQPLPDGSVALHARSVFLPTVSLGGMEFLKEEPFVAPIPTRWRDFFGICEEDVRHL